MDDHPIFDGHSEEEVADALARIELIDELAWHEDPVVETFLERFDRQLPHGSPLLALYDQMAEEEDEILRRLHVIDPESEQFDQLRRTKLEAAGGARWLMSEYIKAFAEDSIHYPGKSQNETIRAIARDFEREADDVEEFEPFDRQKLIGEIREAFEEQVRFNEERT